MKKNIFLATVLSAVFITAAPKVECYQAKVPVLLRNDANQVLQINITGGTTLTELAISTQGTTNLDDIDEVTIYSSGNEKKFITKETFGKTSSGQKSLSSRET
jgi:hypothetical protein